MIKKLKDRLRYHKLSRKQAALQNLLLTAFVLLLGVFGLRAYADAHSVEAAVEKWCEEMYFGEAEILSVLEYEEDGRPWKDVTIGKKLPNGDRYEAKLSLKQKNPWRWEYTGNGMWVTAPMEYTVEPEYIQDWGNDIYRITRQVDVGMFSELTQAEWIEWAYVPTHVMEGLEPGPDSHMSLMVGIQFEESEAANRGEWQQSQLTFWVNLDSMEVEQTYFQQPFPYKGSEGTLWLSEARMVFIAETLMELMPLE